MNDKKVAELLKKIGLTAEQIAEASKDDFDVNGIVTPFNDSQKEHYKPIIENEIKPDIEASVKAEVEGKIYGTLNNDLKKMGVDINAIKDLPVHKKLQVFEQTLVAKNGKPDEAMKAIQDENVELKNKLTDFESKFKTEVETAVNGEKSKVQSRLIDLDLKQKFTSIPADQILGKKHADGILLAIKSHLATKYDLKQDDNENIVAYEKGTAKRAQGKNKDGKEYFLPVEDLLVNSLKELNLNVESNGGEGSGQGGQADGGGNGQGQKSQRVIEMEARFEKAKQG